MASKNNPENRGTVTELRVYNGKKVKPILYINGNRRYIAAAYEDGGALVEDANGDPIPHGNI